MSWEFAEPKNQNNVLKTIVQYNQLMDHIKSELKILENEPLTPEVRKNKMRLKLLKKNTEREWKNYISNK